MALVLPRVFVPRDGHEPPAMSRRNAVDVDERDLLVALESQLSVGGEHHVPLDRQRWAIGRSAADGTTWRVGDAAARERLLHPAWLWTDETTFAPTPGDAARVAPALPLRTLVRQAAPLAGSVLATCQALAATIAGLRRRRRPVAVVASADALQQQGEAARWFALAVLTALPGPWRRRLRVSTNAHAPDPEQWDLVIGASAPRGFWSIRIDVPPAVDDDFVASYLLDRLLARDPEAVEAAAWLMAGDGDDPWGEGVRAHLRNGVPGVSAVAPGQLERDPEGAIQAVLRRLRSGAAIRGPVAADLAEVTVATGDLRPWRLVRAYEAEDRGRAVAATVEKLSPEAGTEALLRTIAALEGFGEGLGAWCAYLVGCLRDGPDPEVARELVETALVEGGKALDTPTRASLWQEVLLADIERGHIDEAVRALLSRFSRQLAAEGASTSLVHAFLALPAHERTLDLLKQLTDAIAQGPSADLAIATLYRGVLLDHTRDEKGEVRGPAVARLVLQHWARLRAQPTAPALARDRVLVQVRGGPQVEDWVQLAAATASFERLKTMIAPVMPADPAQASQLWVSAERAQARAHGTSGRERLVEMAACLPEGGPGLEPVAVELLPELLPDLVFPDDRLAALAADLAEVEGAAPIWMWIAVTAASPEAWPEETLDGTVIAFCEAPPKTPVQRAAALRCVEALAHARGWTVHDQARWIVRLVLAPNADMTFFNYTLAEGLIGTLASRDDGIRLVTQMTREFLGLPLDHPALEVFLTRLLPSVWDKGEAPAPYVDAIEVSGVSADAQQRWRDALGLKHSKQR